LISENGSSGPWNDRKALHDHTSSFSLLPSSFESNQTRAHFEAAIVRAQEYIAAGDIYQVNLAQKFSTPFAGNPYRLFEHPRLAARFWISATPACSPPRRSSSCASEGGM
jgi:anthranilate/para-aminobenzoate synthase component I